MKKGTLFRVISGVMAVGVLASPVVERAVEDYGGRSILEPDAVEAEFMAEAGKGIAMALSANAAEDAAEAESVPDEPDAVEAEPVSDESDAVEPESVPIEPPAEDGEPDTAEEGTNAIEVETLPAETDTEEAELLPPEAVTVEAELLSVEPDAEETAELLAVEPEPEAVPDEPEDETAAARAAADQAAASLRESSLDAYIQRASGALRRNAASDSVTAAEPARVIPVDPEDEPPAASTDSGSTTAAKDDKTTDSGTFKPASTDSGKTAPVTTDAGKAASTDSVPTTTDSGTRATPGAAPFPDVPADDAAADAVRYAAAQGLLGEWGNGLFRPDVLLTRGQAVSLLRRLDRVFRANNALPGSGTLKITEADGSGGDDDEAWAVAMGILDADANHSLDSLVTRGQLAAFLYRYASAVGWNTSCTGDLSARPDGAAVPNYAKLPLSWAMEHGIYRTIVEDSLLPNLAVSRRQAALIVTACLADVVGDPEASSITEAAWKPWFSSASRANHAALETAVTAAAKKYGASGVQVAVIENGHVTDAFATGWAVKDVSAMTASHKVRIASLSKVTLAMATMALKESGAVDLDEPIGTYWGTDIRNPYYPAKSVSLRTILTHTSSISALDSQPTSAAVLGRLAKGGSFRNVVPGSLYGWAYNNYAFGVLGMTLERSNWQTVDQTMWQAFYRAMDIDAAFYGGDLKDTSKIAALYYHGGGTARTAQWQAGEHAGIPGEKGAVFAGGLMISARDLGKLVALLANDGEFEGLRLLQADSVAEMETHGSMKVDTGFYQGLAIRIRGAAYGRDRLCYHTGSAYGVYTGLSYDPDTGDGVVVLTVGALGTRDDYGSYAICGAIYDAVYRAIAK